MADIKVLMVLDGGRFNFGPQQNPNGPEDDNYFGVSALANALENSTTPTIQVDRAHRRGHVFTGVVTGMGDHDHEDCSVNLTYPGDFVFALANPPVANTVTADLSQYDVLWLIGDEGLNGTVNGTYLDAEISDPEKIAIANFMQGGGGVFAVGDHDGIGSMMCGKLPRVRAMRKWFEWDQTPIDAGNGQVFAPNWSVLGLDTTKPNQTDRNDTLRPDSVDGQFYFFDQSDSTPQPLLTQAGAPLASGPVHTILRDQVGAVIANFPDHMHEGEATDFTTVSATGMPFNPNDGSNMPYELTYQDANNQPVSFVEFPMVNGYQPAPEVIAYGSDTGHATFYDAHAGNPDYAVTNPKRGGVVCVYDGHAVGLGRIVTGSTFHHYLDKNLLGDPGTNTLTASHNTQSGLQATALNPILDYYINTVTWLARLSQNFHFWTLKNTFGADETADAAAHGHNFPNAFYLVLDGYRPNQVGLMPTIVLSGPFKDVGANFAQQTALPQGMGGPNTPQRILIPFTVQSIPTGPTPPSAFPASGAPPKVLALEARFIINGTQLAAEALFELVGGANPYFSNLGSAAGEQWYLSQDLRVFQAGPGAPSTPFIGYPGSGSGYDYITQLLGYLNDPAHGFTDATADPFSIINEQNDLTEASSVTPNVANFAIARVRMKGPNGEMATGVKVFFRLWTADSNDTDYDPQSSYRSTLDGAGRPDQPLQALDALNSPLYATSRTGGDYDPGTNEMDITVGPGGEAWRYFGCYLDVYGNPNIVLNGTHHCLVAEIAYDAAPIEGATGVTLSPENSDKLAQRNMQITPSGNPGGPEAHRIPQAFDLRPSLRTDEAAGSLLGYPDELMIDWGDVPIGNVASIYWPQAKAIDVVRLASLLYSADHLQVADAHTVRCRVTSRLTFVPIPFGAGGNFAGLFTIDLPLGIRYGREFQIVVRRISTRQVGGIGTVKANTAVLRSTNEPVTLDWRYVVGTFQVTIPVALEDTLLWPEENVLAILKWRLQNTVPSNRWYPVLQRYVGYVAGRVNAFGGNAGAILPSPNGVPPPKGIPHRGEFDEFTGKVCEVIFDCFGDFEGFVLETCSSIHCFASRERAIGELVLRACRERLVISVVTERAHEHRIRKLIVRS